MALPEFHNTLLVSSLFLYKTDKSPMTSTTTKRHRFLNGLALLLNGSQSCTSIYPWLENKKLLIARNEPLTNDDEIYFNRFFGLIRIYSHFCLTSNEQGMNETNSILRSLVFEYNKDKCIKRILDPLFDNAVSNLEKLLIVNIDRICENVAVGELSKGSADYIYLNVRQMLLIEYIPIIFSWVNHILLLRESIRKDKKSLDLSTIEKFQQYCQFLYTSETFRSIVAYKYPFGDDHKRIEYYIDKVSAHLRSLKLILLCLKQRKSQYGEVYKDIQWHFIEPIETIVKLEATPSSTFDNICSACSLSIDETKNLKAQNICDKFKVYDKELQLSACLHSEIRMIDYLIEQEIHEVHDDDIEIGISKLPCYPCSLYIEELNQKFNRKFCIGGLLTHGKIYPKWTFRNNEDEEIKKNVNMGLHKLVKNEVLEWGKKIRTKSGESDKQETDVDNDDDYLDSMKFDINQMESINFKSTDEKH